MRKRATDVSPRRAFAESRDLGDTIEDYVSRTRCPRYRSVTMLDVQASEAVAVLTLNRQERRNALDHEARVHCAGDEGSDFLRPYALGAHASGRGW